MAVSHLLRIDLALELELEPKDGRRRKGDEVRESGGEMPVISFSRLLLVQLFSRRLFERSRDVRDGPSSSFAGATYLSSASPA